MDGFVPSTQQDAVLKLTGDQVINCEKKNVGKVENIEIHPSLMYCCNPYNGLSTEDRWSGADPSAVRARQCVIPFPHSLEGKQDAETETVLKTDDFIRGCMFIYMLASGEKLGYKQGNNRPVRPEFLNKIEQRMFEAEHTESSVGEWAMESLVEDGAHEYTSSIDLYKNYKSFTSRDKNRLKKKQFDKALKDCFDSKGMYLSMVVYCMVCYRDYSYGRRNSAGGHGRRLFNKQDVLQEFPETCEGGSTTRRNKCCTEHNLLICKAVKNMRLKSHFSRTSADVRTEEEGSARANSLFG